MLPSQGIDWWREPAVSSNGMTWSDIRVTPANHDSVVESLKTAGIEYRVMIEDVQASIDEQLRPAPSTNDNDDWFTAYHNYTATMAWLRALAQQYSSIADIVTVGKTYEGRDILGIHITGKRDQNVTKPGIFNDGGIHAREWIAPATIQYLLFNFLSKYGSDPTVTKFVDGIDFTFVPIFNADGYEYTWARDRMWRKTRMPNTGSSCVGTDPCRNAATGWGGGGSSSNPCDETYRGKKAFDQPEVLAIANYVKKLGNVKYYNNYHSYSELWMGPYGYTFSTPPSADFAKQQEVGKLAAQAIQATHGLRYGQGPVASTIYQASGIMCDEIYKASGVILSYTCELRDTGTYGFLLPASQIKPQGEEIWAATLAICQYVLDHVHEL
jgi:murein tripeptide amidase MpaA